MDEFFKGYVVTKNKKSIEPFRNRNDFKTYEEIQYYDEFAGILADNTILIDIDDSEIFNLIVEFIKQLEENISYSKIQMWINVILIAI